MLLQTFLLQEQHGVSTAQYGQGTARTTVELFEEVGDLTPCRPLFLLVALQAIHCSAEVQTSFHISFFTVHVQKQKLVHK